VTEHLRLNHLVLVILWVLQNQQYYLVCDTGTHRRGPTRMWQGSPSSRTRSSTSLSGESGKRNAFAVKSLETVMTHEGVAPRTLRAYRSERWEWFANC
jgi:hypothetical protein